MIVVFWFLLYLYSSTMTATVDGQWSAWSQWSACQVTCGAIDEKQHRHRQCDNPAPANGGDNCIGDQHNNRHCPTDACPVTATPVNGNWSTWGAWSGCPATCGQTGDIMTRIRIFSLNRTLNYHVGRLTPVNGNWSPWGAWSGCPATCGQPGDSMTRTRSCDDPPPQYSGQQCPGNATQHEKCSMPACTVVGNWLAWSDWSTCTATCGHALQMRSRACDMPGTCQGDNSGVLQCVGQRPC